MLGQYRTIIKIFKSSLRVESGTFRFEATQYPASLHFVFLIHILRMTDLLKVQFLVLDLTAMQYCDPSGAGALQGLAAELAERGVSVYLAGTSGNSTTVLSGVTVG
jgi:MFS superfamily sulfate permease-like transporter